MVESEAKNMHGLSRVKGYAPNVVAFVNMDQRVLEGFSLAVIKSI